MDADSLDFRVAYAWIGAEARALQRTPDDVAARDRQMARCWVRCIVARVRMRGRK
jgi:hypothetical protein